MVEKTADPHYYHSDFSYNPNSHEISALGSVALPRITNNILKSIYPANRIRTHQYITNAAYPETTNPDVDDYLRTNFYRLKEKFADIGIEGVIVCHNKFGYELYDENQPINADERRFKFSTFKFYPERGLYMPYGNNTANLNYLEARLLDILCISAEEVVPNETIINYMWGGNSDATMNNLTVQLSRLRKQMGRIGNIETVEGVGLKFSDKPQLKPAA